MAQLEPVPGFSTLCDHQVCHTPPGMGRTPFSFWSFVYSLAFTGAEFFLHHYRSFSPTAPCTCSALVRPGPPPFLRLEWVALRYPVRPQDGKDRGSKIRLV